jgi:hypothetical protein
MEQSLENLFKKKIFKFTNQVISEILTPLLFFTDLQKLSHKLNRRLIRCASINLV